jgi:hypothetical protein
MSLPQSAKPGGIPMTVDMQRQFYDQVKNRYGAKPKGTDDEVQAG